MKENKPGNPVDSSGNYALDPTYNVLQLVQAAVRRIDDLRYSDRNHDAEIHNAESKRLDDLRAAESRRIDEQMILVNNHARELREAEAKRIDAIRAVDVNAVAVASERAVIQATVLATQVSQSADALRTLVSTTAVTMAAAQEAASKQFNERLGQVERTQYENKGKSGVEDPLMEKLITKMDSLLESRATHSGEGTGMKSLWGLIAGGIILLIAIVTVVISLSKAGIL